MSDLVERLHDLANQLPRDRGNDAVDDALREAASSISQQDAELERMRREVEEAREKLKYFGDLHENAYREMESRAGAAEAALAEARKAAFIEAAEIAEQTIVPNSSGAALGANLRAERIAGALRAKAEETDR